MNRSYLHLLLLTLFCGPLPAFAQSDFTMGWYHDHSGGSSVWDEMKAHGFNTVMNYEMSHLHEFFDPNDVVDQLVWADQRDMKMQFHLSGDLIRSSTGGNWSRLDSVVNAYKNYPAVASWQMSDEPESSDFIDPNVYGAAANHIRQIDPAHAISAIHTKDDNHSAYVPFEDITSVDNYPILSNQPNPNLRAYTKSAQDIVDLANQSGAQPLFVAQAFDADPEFSEPYVLPSAEQQRFLTYAPLTVGIQGLMYWTFHRIAPQNRIDEVYPVTDRIFGLHEVLESTDTPPQITSDGDGSSQGDGLVDVTYTVRQYQGSTYIIAANNTNAVRQVNFDIAGQLPAGALVDVLHENRSLSIQSSGPSTDRFSDSFDPYTVHLYEVIPQPTSGPVVGYWRFEEEFGPVAFDGAVSPAEHGILAGGAQRSTNVADPQVPHTGQPNTSSMQFDGVAGSAINMGADPDLDVGSGDFTLEAYVNLQDALDFPLIAGKQVSGNFFDQGFELQARPDAANGGGEASPGKWKGLFRTGDGAILDDLFTADLDFNTWYHLAAVRNGNLLSLYVDGNLRGSKTITGSGDFTSGQEFSIGGANITGSTPGIFGRAANGLVDEVRLSNTALSVAEFLNASPLAFHWQNDSSGVWNDAASWMFGVPNTNERTAVFGDVITADRSVLNAVAVTVKGVRFDNANSYVITGPGSIHLDADTGNVAIDVLQGSHEFQQDVLLQDATDVDVAGGAVLNFNNELNLNGMTLTKTGMGALNVNNALTGGGTLDCQAGSCGGAGTLIGELVNSGGTVSPGNSPGVLEVQGDYRQSEHATLLIELGGDGLGAEYDQLAVTGAVELGGELVVTLTSGFEPEVGDRFDILTWQEVTGSFDQVDLPTLPVSMMWDTSQLYATGTGSLAVTAVPEPSVYVLPVMGMLYVLCSRIDILNAFRSCR